MRYNYHEILESRLEKILFSPGTIYFTTDSGKLFLDPVGGGVRKLIGGDFETNKPVKGIDYWTEDDKSEIVNTVIKSLGGDPVFGYVDQDNNIIVSGNLPDGSYSISYKLKDGSTIAIGDLVLDNNVYYSVTNTLINCTNDNSATRVVQGDSYSATISAESNYELSSVVVTMGGTDISVSAVSGGEITIENVTGDISITATADEVESEPKGNLADPTSADWGTNKRLAAGYGYSKDLDGFILTNYIPAKSGDIVRVKGLKLNGYMSSTSAAVGCYSSTDKTADTTGRLNAYLNYRYTGVSSTASGEGAKEQVTVNDGVYTYTILLHGDGTQKAKTNTAYIRISAPLDDGYTAEDVVITINEEIDSNTSVTPVYTNLADPTSADWQEGYRMSISAGTSSVLTGHTTTNYIPAQVGDVLRVKGLRITGTDGNGTEGANYAKIVAFNANKSNLGGAYGNTKNINTGEYGLKVIVEGDVSEYTIMLKNDDSQPTADIAYIRIDGFLMDGYTKNDVVITINEEITDDAPVAPTYTNFAAPTSSDWKVGYRLTSDINQVTPLPGGVATNYIAVQNGDVVTVEGINFEDNNNRIAHDGANMGIGKADVYATTYTSQGLFENVTYNSNSITLTVKIGTISNMRFSGLATGTSNDVVVKIKRNGEWL